MRITEYQRTSIVNNAKTIFEENSKVYLFGSRVDDSKRGRYIDIFIECNREKNCYENRRDYIAKLYEAIGYQKIDVVLKTIDAYDDRLIVAEALSKGILL